MRRSRHCHLKRPRACPGYGSSHVRACRNRAIPEVIAGIEERAGIVIDKEKASIDQVRGLEKACEMGYRNIAVSVVFPGMQ